MARLISAKCRLCRREGIKLFLKGDRCFTVKCSIDKREKPPGQHGDKKVRITDFGAHLREKQKAKRYYGLLERQFKHFFKKAQRMTGNTGENLIVLLERKLDNVVYRLGFAPSMTCARQLIRHKHITVNDKIVDVPSFLVKPNDLIKPRNKKNSIKIIKENVSKAHKEVLPSWLSVIEESLEGRVINMPVKEEVPVPFKEQMIVEFCSR